MQQFWIGDGHTSLQVYLPAPDEEVLHGIPWGRADTLDTPAYWALRCKSELSALEGFTDKSASLLEEIGFCLLGGFGITAELNTAAFCRLRSAGVFDRSTPSDEAAIKELLIEPLQIEGRVRRYRFPNQRSRRIAAMRQAIDRMDLDSLSENHLRLILRNIEGIGPKTAAWIIRNHFDSDAVAILDVHVIRACSRFKLFPERVVLPRDYDFLQERFLRLARALEVRPAVLDAVMWTEMRNEKRSRQQLAA